MPSIFDTYFFLEKLSFSRLRSSMAFWLNSFEPGVRLIFWAWKIWNSQLVFFASRAAKSKALSDVCEKSVAKTTFEMVPQKEAAGRFTINTGQMEAFTIFWNEDSVF